MRSVPQHLLPLVPLFCRSLTQMGTDKESFIELTERIGRKTGGLSVSTMVSPVRGKQEPVAKLMVRREGRGDTHWHGRRGDAALGIGFGYQSSPDLTSMDQP